MKWDTRCITWWWLLMCGFRHVGLLRKFGSRTSPWNSSSSSMRRHRNCDGLHWCPRVNGMSQLKHRPHSLHASMVIEGDSAGRSGTAFGWTCETVLTFKGQKGKRGGPIGTFTALHLSLMSFVNPITSSIVSGCRMYSSHGISSRNLDKKQFNKLLWLNPTIRMAKH